MCVLGSSEAGAIPLVVGHIQHALDATLDVNRSDSHSKLQMLGKQAQVRLPKTGAMSSFKCKRES
jgi:hypothetical protein